MAELVDALDSKSCSFGSAGSIPARGTKTSVSIGARENGFKYLVLFFALISSLLLPFLSFILINCFLTVFYKALSHPWAINITFDCDDKTGVYKY